MKVYDLLEELKEIAENSYKVPISGKSLVDAEDILDIVNEIINELPAELQRAQWITDEKNRLISEAENEKAVMLADAKAQAEALIDENDITNKSRVKAEEILARTEMQCKNLKMSTYNYLDNVMSSMIERVEKASEVYIGDMYENLKKSFEMVEETLTDNKAELKNLAYQESVKGNLRDSLDADFNPIETEEKAEEE